MSVSNWSPIGGHGKVAVQAEIPPSPKDWGVFEPLKLFKRDGDRGLGDILHRQLGGEKFPLWFAEKFGKSCGCSDRVQWLNRKFLL